MKSAPKNNYLILMIAMSLLSSTAMFSANTPPPPPTPFPPGVPIDQNLIVLIVVAVAFGYFSVVKKYKKQI